MEISIPFKGFSSEVFVLSITIIIGWVFLRNWKSRELPPGPPSLPFIGSLLSLRGDDVRETMLSLARKYGDIFTLDMGNTRMVVLASYDRMKEVLVKNGLATSGRSDGHVVWRELTQGRGQCVWYIPDSKVHGANMGSIWGRQDLGGWAPCCPHELCYLGSLEMKHLVLEAFLIAMFVGPTWGPSGADGTQVGPMLAPWTLLSGILVGDLTSQVLSWDVITYAFP